MRRPYAGIRPGTDPTESGATGPHFNTSSRKSLKSFNVDLRIPTTSGRSHSRGHARPPEDGPDERLRPAHLLAGGEAGGGERPAAGETERQSREEHRRPGGGGPLPPDLRLPRSCRPATALLDAAGGRSSPAGDMRRPSYAIRPENRSLRVRRTEPHFNTSSRKSLKSFNVDLRIPTTSGRSHSRGHARPPEDGPDERLRAAYLLAGGETGGGERPAAGETRRRRREEHRRPGGGRPLPPDLRLPRGRRSAAALLKPGRRFVTGRGVRRPSSAIRAGEPLPPGPARGTPLQHFVPQVVEIGGCRSANTHYTGPEVLLGDTHVRRRTDPTNDCGLPTFSPVVNRWRRTAARW